MKNREKVIESIIENVAAMRRAFRLNVGSTDVKHGGLPPGQIGILLLIEKNGGVTVKDLADQLCISSSAITQLLTALHKRALVERREDDVDRRKVRLALTEEGRRLLEKMKKERVKHFAARLAKLTDEELLALEHIQKKLSV